MNPIIESSTVVAVGDQVSCDLSGEVVILELHSGAYYGLEAVGARIWKLLEEPRTVREIRGRLLEEYDVDPERCGSELLALLGEMADRGLIVVRSEGTS